MTENRGKEIRGSYRSRLKGSTDSDRNLHVLAVKRTVGGMMLRGFKTIDYSTPVRVQDNRRDFEIYQLAEQYNKKWLPIKRRIIEIKKSKER